MIVDIVRLDLDHIPESLQVGPLQHFTIFRRVLQYKSTVNKPQLLNLLFVNWKQELGFKAYICKSKYWQSVEIQIKSVGLLFPELLRLKQYRQRGPCMLRDFTHRSTKISPTTVSLLSVEDISHVPHTTDLISEETRLNGAFQAQQMNVFLSNVVKLGPLKSFNKENFLVWHIKRKSKDYQVN